MIAIWAGLFALVMFVGLVIFLEFWEDVLEWFHQARR